MKYEYFEIDLTNACYTVIPIILGVYEQYYIFSILYTSENRLLMCLF